MKKIIPKLSFNSILLGAFSYLGFLILSSVSEDAPILSLSLLISIEGVSFSPFFVPLAFVLSFLTNKSSFLLYSLVTAVISVIFFGIFRLKEKTPKIEILPLLCSLIILYVLFPINGKIIFSENKIYGGIFTLLFSCITFIATRSLVKKNFKIKLGLEELFSVFTVFSIAGLGISNFISPLVFKGIAIFTLLACGYLFSGREIYAFGIILGFGLSIYYKNLSYVSLFLCIAVVSDTLSNFSRYLSPLGVLATDYLLEQVFSLRGGFTSSDILSLVIPSALFLIIPTKLLRTLKSKLNIFKEKRIVRETLNRQRTATSNRLFELSNVFREMSSAFKIFNECDLTENFSKNHVKRKIKENACGNCENSQRCMMSGTPSEQDLNKFLDIGFAKGKVSLIDLPNSFSENCAKPNNVLFTTNKLLAEHRRALIDKINVKNGRELLAMQSLSVSEVLNSLAVETGTVLKFRSEKERVLSDALKKRGIITEELLIYGEKESFSISAIISGDELPEELIEKEVSKNVGFRVKIEDKYPVTSAKTYVKLSIALDYDCVFGVSNLAKDGTAKSGDTHSVLRISKSKLLVALSDGMGTGTGANNLSSVSLSLIESFYKAGLKGDAVLNTVNKLLSINTEDSFTALDVSVIDLKNLTADFIKYGAPYGFIIGEGGIRIVSGSTLPLGILDEVKPSVAKTKINENDAILLVSDGVSDAFGSSDEIINFLKKLPAFNPQTLADEVVKAAKLASNGKCQDDMTAVAVRVFKTA